MMESVFVAMDLIHLPVRFEEPSEIVCSRCYSILELHQLDVRMTARMLGTCDECKAWYLIDAEEGLMVLLPDETDLRNA